jgi:hypothetical protein
VLVRSFNFHPSPPAFSNVGVTLESSTISVGEGVGEVVSTGVGVALGCGVAVIVPVGAGDGVAVIVPVGAGDGVAVIVTVGAGACVTTLITTPLFQTNFLPLLIQVYFLPL